MKKNTGKIIGNIVVIGVLVTLLIFLGVRNPYAYKDSGSQSIDITSRGNMKIESIEGFYVDGDLIQVQTDYTYMDLVVSYQGEKVRFDEGFTFYSDSPSHQTYNLNYSFQTDSMYLERDLSSLAGWDTISLLLIGVIAYCMLHIVSLVGQSREEVDHSRITISPSRHLENILLRVKMVLLATLGIGFFLIWVFVDIYSILELLSDTMLILFFISYCIVIVVGSTIIEYRKHNLVFDFSGQGLTVMSGNQTIFETSLDRLVYQETLAVQNHDARNKHMIQRDLYLSSKDSDTAPLKCNLMPFSIESYQMIIRNLRKASQGLVYDQVIADKKQNGRFELQGSEVKTSVSFIILFILFMLATISIPLMIILGNKENSQMVLLFFVFAIVVMIATFGMMIFSKTRKKLLYIVVTPTTIQINGDIFNKENIREISLTSPNIFGNQMKNLRITDNQRKRQWNILLSTKSRNSHSESLEYCALYSILQELYDECFSVF